VDVSVILPTYNERECLTALKPRLDAALLPFRSEVVVVDDDSPDGTGDLVRAAERTGGWRLLARKGRRGLASAVLDGIADSEGEVIVVMDADGSHPPETLPLLIGPLRSGQAEMVLASRFVPGGSDLGLHGARRAVSYLATRLARPLTKVRDPMTGFFALRREILRGAVLTPLGYKIGLEILVKCRPRRVLEVPFVFEGRIAGTSKLGSRQVAAYVRHIGRLYRWRFTGPGRASSTRYPPPRPRTTTDPPAQDSESHRW
jgi:dolichol-phosphate mannosyltransferase